MPRTAAKASGPRALSSAALAVAAQRFKDAVFADRSRRHRPRHRESRWSRRSDLRCISGRSRQLADSARYYIGSIAGISLLSMLAFQAADIYQVQAFRGHEKQYMRLASAWSVVFLLADRHVVLHQSRRPILPGLARQLLCGRTGRAHRVSARLVPPGAPLDAAGPPRPPHRRGRRGRQRRGADRRARRAARFRRARHRRVRRSRRRPQPRRAATAFPSSAPSTTSSSSPATPASISSSSRCRSRRKAASCKC